VSLDVASYVAIIRAGYPRGIPETDYSTLLAIVRRRFSDGEIAALATDLVARGEFTMNIDVVDIGAAIARISDEPASAATVKLPDAPMVVKPPLDVRDRRRSAW
jgi:Protein of unknown function (DUF3349)